MGDGPGKPGQSSVGADPCVRPDPRVRPARDGNDPVGADPCVRPGLAPAKARHQMVGADPRVRPGLELKANNGGGYAGKRGWICGEGTGYRGRADTWVRADTRVRPYGAL